MRRGRNVPTAPVLPSPCGRRRFVLKIGGRHYDGCVGVTLTTRRRGSPHETASRAGVYAPRRGGAGAPLLRRRRGPHRGGQARRSEEHTSELQSRGHLVCRLLLEKKKEVLKEGVKALVIGRQEVSSVNCRCCG